METQRKTDLMVHKQRRLGYTASRALHWLFIFIIWVGCGALGGDYSRLSAPAGPAARDARLNISADNLTVGSDGQVKVSAWSGHPAEEVTLALFAPGSGKPQISGRSTDFFGIGGVQIHWLAPQDRETEIALAKAAGVGMIGLDFHWGDIEPEQGVYHWENTDEIVRLARKYDLRLVPMLLYTPRWAASLPFATMDYQRIPPLEEALYRDFVYEVVNRYKPYGVLPATYDGWGITDWVMWNEPNVQQAGKQPLPGNFWFGSLDAYIQLLRAGYEGAHAADPDCNVLNGGLADVAWKPGEADLATAVERLYHPNGDGNSDDGGRPYFDTLNVHTYQEGESSAKWYQERIEAVQRIMLRYGDADKKIWVTETGYGSYNAADVRDPAVLESTQYLNEDQQAEAIHTVFETLAAYPQVERVFWWSLRDYFVDTTLENTVMEAHYGLLRTNYLPKPAYLELARLTGSLDTAFTTVVKMSNDEAAIAAIPAAALTVLAPT